MKLPDSILSRWEYWTYDDKKNITTFRCCVYEGQKRQLQSLFNEVEELDSPDSLGMQVFFCRQNFHDTELIAQIEQYIKDNEDKTDWSNYEECPCCGN